YGLMDESAKLNLNLLDRLKLDDEQVHTLLMNLPGMTVETADCILDWIDTDDTRRPYGAESDFYESLTPPYRAKNGPIESLDELLMVQGVTPALLYGEDANRNGLLDPNENDGDKSPPMDDADGMLIHGWSAYLTAHSRESNRRADGTKKINLNNGLLTELYDSLLESFDEDTAKFVIAFRMNGPKDQPPPTSTGTTVASSSSSSSQKKQNQQAVQGLTQALAEAAFNKSGTVTRGRIDISKGGPYKIATIWDLIGSRADVTINEVKSTLTSPWSAQTNSLTTLLPKLTDTLTTTGDDYLEGRINLNQARREILVGLPGMTTELTESIVTAQKLDVNGQPDEETILRHNISGWLFIEGLVDIWKMRELDPYLTARGDVYRAQVFGFFDGGGPVTRLEAMVDATRVPPRILFQRDLDDLGRGYSRFQLLPVSK
ncbi:MAG: general secretion pathway protein GspK, partial [Planctomycetes bacterium]|nr:general secretion pathway protein GspK [Planctomycetota bacterium]